MPEEDPNLLHDKSHTTWLTRMRHKLGMYSTYEIASNILKYDLQLDTEIGGLYGVAQLVTRSMTMDDAEILMPAHDTLHVVTTPMVRNRQGSRHVVLFNFAGNIDTVAIEHYFENDYLHVLESQRSGRDLFNYVSEHDGTSRIALPEGSTLIKLFPGSKHKMLDIDQKAKSLYERVVQTAADASQQAR